MIRKGVIAIVVASCALLQTASAASYKVSTATDIVAKIPTLQAGDSLVVAKGTYSITTRLDLASVGTASKPIFFGVVGTDRAVFNFNGQDTSDLSQGLYIIGNYWYVRNLDITKTGDNGILIENPPEPLGSSNYSDKGLGSYNTLEACNTYRCNDAGIQIKRYGSHNKIINCDSYFNYDSKASGGNADGFSPKMGPGDTYFFGCRSWNNSDDGWDGYIKDDQCLKTPITTTEYCICYYNGYTEKGENYEGMNGNGFKMGGPSSKYQHNWIIRNCLAVKNFAKGFDNNHNQGDEKLYNCTAANNGALEYSLYESKYPGTTGSATNCVSVGSDNAVSGGKVTTSGCNWAAAAGDFVSTTEKDLIGPRAADGSYTQAIMNVYCAKSGSTEATNKQGWMQIGDVPKPSEWSTPVLPQSSFRATTKAGELIGTASKVLPNVTKVEFTALAAGKLDIAVCDISGKNIMNISNNFSAGNQAQIIDLSKVSSGMYLCKFKYISANGIKMDNLKIYNN